MMQRPVAPIHIRKRICELASSPVELELSKGAVGSLKGALNAALKEIAQAYGLTPDEARHLVLGWVCGEDKPLTSDGMTNARWYAVGEWIGVYKDETDGRWKAHQAFKTEAVWCFNAAKWGENPNALPVEATEDYDASFLPGAEVTAAARVPDTPVPAPKAPPKAPGVVKIKQLPPSYRKGRPQDL